MSEDNIFLQAWNEIIKDRVNAESCYLSFYERVPYYGGPEEGGWWGSLHILQEYCKCSSREAAEMLMEKLQERCEQLNNESKITDGENCLRHMERADQRGEDVDDHGYDGPSTYYMLIESAPGQNQQTSYRHYE